MPITGRYEPSATDWARQQAERDCLAREAVGAERAIWWERAVAAWPDFDRYTVGLSCSIPLFVLRPVRAPR